MAETCELCNGTGLVKCGMCHGNGGSPSLITGLGWEPCPRCKQSGEVNCGRCNGIGKLRTGENVKLDKEEAVGWLSTCLACAGFVFGACIIFTGVVLFIELKDQIGVPASATILALLLGVAVVGVVCITIFLIYRWKTKHDRKIKNSELQEALLSDSVGL